MKVTNYFKKYGMEDISIFKKEHYDYFYEKNSDDLNESIMKFLSVNNIQSFIFHTGIIMFTVGENWTENGYSKECFVYLLFRAKDCKDDSNKFLEELKKMLRINNCSKIMMVTKIDPNFWIKNWDNKFKIKEYKMELDL